MRRSIIFDSAKMDIIASLRQSLLGVTVLLAESDYGLLSELPCTIINTPVNRIENLGTYCSDSFLHHGTET